MTPHYAVSAANACVTLAQCELDSIDSGEVVEPGYQDGLRFFGNWNTCHARQADGYYRSPNHAGELPDDKTMERLGNILEKMGYTLEWSDEWSSCDGCGKFIRTEPDCYGWKQYGAMVGECDLHCGDCIAADPDAYLEGCLNNPDTAVGDFVNLVKAGFAHMNEDGSFESGFHPGQTDDPAQVLAEYQKRHPDHDFVFSYEPSQFNVEFEIWGKVKSAESKEH